jgi:YVTN family beta-propeller protein
MMRCPVGIAYDPINHRMYVANQADNTVSVIDTTTTPPSVINSPITVGEIPTGIAYDPINRNMYVTNQAIPGSVSVVDTNTNTEIDTITVGNQPLGLAYDTINHRIYVANSGEDTVSVINLCPRPEL